MMTFPQIPLPTEPLEQNKFYTSATVSSALSNVLKIVTVKTEWVDRHNTRQSVELKTAISRYSEFD